MRGSLAHEVGVVDLAGLIEPPRELRHPSRSRKLNAFLEGSRI
jgi:hypothetical protein